MKRLLLSVLGILLITSISYADWTLNPHTGRLDYYEPAGAGSGDSITIYGVAVDTTGNFTNSTEIKWAITDGGAGGPDAIEASLVKDYLEETELDDESELEAQIADMANIIQETEIDAFSELDAIVADKDLVNKADGATWLGTHDFSSATVTLPVNVTDSDQYVDGSIDAVHLAADIIDETKIADDGIDSEHYNADSIDNEHINWADIDNLNDEGLPIEIYNSAADVALADAGDIHFNTADEQLSIHSGADGEISGEVSFSPIGHVSAVFDPDAICDGNEDRVFLFTVGDDMPEGIIIDEWKVSFGADPTTEADLDLKYADAFIGVANAAVIDVLDTTNGAASEDTDANINSGNAVANGKVVYLEFGTAYTATGEKIIFEMWFHREED